MTTADASDGSSSATVDHTGDAQPAAGPAALAAASSAHFLHDGLADSLYVLLPLWAAAFGLGYTEVGALRTAYSAAMAACQLPAGMLAERLGERWLLSAGTILAGLAFAAMAAATGFATLLVAILLVGLGSAVQHPLASAIVSRAYPPARRRSALGVYNFFGDVGKMVVSFAIAAAAGVVGWQAAAAGYGAIVVAAGVALLVGMLAARLGARCAATESLPAGAAAPAGDRLGLTDARGFRLLAAVHVIDSAARTGTLTLLPFVLMAKGASPGLVGFALALIFAGGAAGKLVCGVLADRLGILRTIVATEVATASIVAAAVLAPLEPTLLLMPVLGVALNGTSSVLYGSVTDFVRPERQSRAFGLFYTLGSFAGGTSPLVFGAFGDVVGLVPTVLSLAAFVLAAVPVAILLRPHLERHGA